MFLSGSSHIFPDILINVKKENLPSNLVLLPTWDVDPQWAVCSLGTTGCFIFYSGNVESIPCSDMFICIEFNSFSQFKMENKKPIINEKHIEAFEKMFEFLTQNRLISVLFEIAAQKDSRLIEKEIDEFLDSIRSGKKITHQKGKSFDYTFKKDILTDYKQYLVQNLDEF